MCDPHDGSLQKEEYAAPALDARATQWRHEREARRSALHVWREGRRSSAGLRRACTLILRLDLRRAFGCWLHQHALAFRESETELRILTVLRSMRNLALR